ncbi:hypothetical protein [Nostoc sp. 'Lobaria pulmonaria (5183) cyanobiont']|uniref:hypothetical protein n=1 Tax=Nostoc sp. 'Lobaria pulmonaria (5183) cyanobiont' TaxID=1618022 RepID=UPI000CF32970|nr:hypothetical protein [Nostoc sp. 'Lobaria pulmonaria (5183) cyanobiont']
MFNFSYAPNWLLRNYQESPKRQKSLKGTIDELNRNQVKMSDSIAKLNIAIDKQTAVTDKLLQWLQNAPNKP